MPEKVKKKRKAAKKYTEKEDKFLRDNCKKMSVKEMCEILGRSNSSVSNRTLRLGLREHRSDEFQTEEYDDFIRENYYSMTNKELSKRVGKSERQLVGRVEKLGLKLKGRSKIFTDGQKKFLYEECGNYTAREMANILEKNENHIRELIRKAGLKFKSGLAYTDSQKAFVKENYPTMDTEEIMKIIGVKDRKVVHKLALNMGVKKLSAKKDGKKICKKCKRILPLEEFIKNGKSYRSICNLCVHDEKLKKVLEETTVETVSRDAKRAKALKAEKIAKGVTKVCTLCNEELPATEFYYGKGRCKKCFNSSIKKQRLEKIKTRGY